MLSDLAQAKEARANAVNELEKYRELFAEQSHAHDEQVGSRSVGWFGGSFVEQRKVVRGGAEGWFGSLHHQEMMWRRRIFWCASPLNV